MIIFAIASLGLILAYAVLQGGAEEPRDWNPCLLAIGLLSLVYWLCSRRRDLAPPPDRLTRWLLLALLSVILFEIVPLPLAILRWLSPARVELLEAGAPILGGFRFATLSILPATTLQWLLGLAGCVLVFLLLREISWRSEDHPWAPALPFLVIALLEAALGIAQYHLQGSQSLAQGTYVNRNHFAGFLEMSLPFPILYAVAVLRRSRKRFEAPVWPAVIACALISVAAVILFAITLSLSRMGLISTLSSLLVVGSLGLARGWPAWKRSIAIVLVAALVILGFLLLPTERLIARYGDLNREELSADIRAQIWRDTLRLIAAYPVFGCGLGGYHSGLLRYKTVTPMLTVDFAHNDYLQILAEMGALGFLIFLALAFRILYFSLRAAVGSRGQGRYLALACAGSFTAILLHSFVDFNLYIPANAMLLAWIAGVAAGAGRR
jgi:O-antigen ligase